MRAKGERPAKRWLGTVLLLVGIALGWMPGTLGLVAVVLWRLITPILVLRESAKVLSANLRYAMIAAIFAHAALLPMVLLRGETDGVSGGLLVGRLISLVWIVLYIREADRSAPI